MLILKSWLLSVEKIRVSSVVLKSIHLTGPEHICCIIAAEVFLLIAFAGKVATLL